MSKKSFDQRLKDRWRWREQRESDRRHTFKGFYNKADRTAGMAMILPLIFGKAVRQNPKATLKEKQGG